MGTLFESTCLKLEALGTKFVPIEDTHIIRYYKGYAELLCVSVEKNSVYAIKTALDFKYLGDNYLTFSDYDKATGKRYVGLGKLKGLKLLECFPPYYKDIQYATHGLFHVSPLTAGDTYSLVDENDMPVVKTLGIPIVSNISMLMRFTGFLIEVYNFLTEQVISFEAEVLIIMEDCIYLEDYGTNMGYFIDGFGHVSELDFSSLIIDYVKVDNSVEMLIEYDNETVIKGRRVLGMWSRKQGFFYKQK